LAGGFGRDRDQRSSNCYRFTRPGVQFLDCTGERRGNDDHGFGGFDIAKRRVNVYPGAFFYAPGHQLGLRQSLPEIW
jgi:hypothetical protein